MSYNPLYYVKVYQILNKYISENGICDLIFEMLYGKLSEDRKRKIDLDQSLKEIHMFINNQKVHLD